MRRSTLDYLTGRGRVLSAEFICKLKLHAHGYELDIEASKKAGKEIYRVKNVFFAKFYQISHKVHLWFYNLPYNKHPLTDEEIHELVKLVISS